MKEARELPRFAVLLAAYNGRSWLPDQVESILEQDGVDITLFVSVDASSDGTEAWIQERAEADMRIQLLPGQQQRQRAAGNFFRLLRETPAEPFEYFAFADQDDIWDSDKLAHAVVRLREQNADAYSSNVCAFWPDGQRRMIVKSQPQRRWDFLFEAAGPGCTYVFSRRLFEDLQRFAVDHREQLQAVDLHDWFCYAFARARGYRWFIDPEAKMAYRQHARNHVGVNSGIKAVLVRSRRIAEGWWIAQARTIALLLELDGHSFVAKWITPGRRSGYLHLATHALQCRRRLIDGLFMAAAMLVLCFSNP
ncbi:glycosyltransferase [Pseudomonas sp.]|uniref:glycosyltransferase n=1 Tax=Pseudomonas sp. TaxID=306 RepID=UPI00272D7252|nr:glycosyltransferase [Pseudomonas sp.]